MKGVLASRAPQARVVDISHDIPAQDLLRGGLVWASATPYFPPGSIHIAVVDPGVGGRRRILAFEARGVVFLVPDNGMIGYVLERREVRRVVNVTRCELFLKPLSATFHGRDIFAPVAAALAGGLEPVACGREVKSYRRLGLPRPRRRWVRSGRQRRLRLGGEVVAVDHFGSLITNLRPEPDASLAYIECGTLRLEGLSRAYGDVRRGQAVALVGSTGHVEIAVRDGNAARIHSVGIGQPVASEWV